MTTSQQQTPSPPTSRLKLLVASSQAELLRNLQRKRYFRERDLLAKAVDVKLTGNLPLPKQDEPNVRCSWKVCRTDVLSEYKSERGQQKRICSPPKKHVPSHTVCASQRSLSICRPTKLPTLQRSASIGKAQTGERKALSSGEYKKLLEGRNSVLLRYFTERRFSHVGGSRTKQRNPNEKIRPWDQQVWVKEYSVSSESRGEERVDRRKKTSAIESVVYDPITGARNRDYINSIESLLSHSPKAARRKTSSITLGLEARPAVRPEYQAALARRPKIFRRNGQLCWREVVGRKSYGQILRRNDSLDRIS